MKRIEFGLIKVNESSKRHVQECFDSNWISMGRKVKQFEETYRNLFGYPFTRAVSSGTAADMACCLSLYDFGARTGDEIICPALSFIASFNAIRAAGFTPKFVDVRHDMNINTDLIEEQISPKTAAIMVVNLMGRPAELDKVQEIGKKHNLKIICDNCESYGSRYKGKYALDYCDMETSSHYTAHLCCMGEGGTVSCKDPKIDEVIESVRSHGRIGGSLYFDHPRYGLNLKTSDLHAAVGLGELENFWRIFDKRRANVKRLREAVRGLEDAAWFTEEEEENMNCPHAFSITLKEKYKDKINDFQKFLDTNSIHWKRNFGGILKHGAFAYLRDQGPFPVADYIGDYGLHVGCHYYLSDDDLTYLGKKIRTFLENL